jgi:hypothetical protein
LEPTSPKLTEEALDVIAVYGGKAGPLNTKEMEEVRQFHRGDDYICVQPCKTNAQVRVEMEETIQEFEETVEGRFEESRSIVCSNTEFTCAVVGKPGRYKDCLNISIFVTPVHPNPCMQGYVA